MAWNNTVTCSSCWERGHNKAGCPTLKERMQKKKDERKAKRLKESGVGLFQDGGYMPNAPIPAPPAAPATVGVRNCIEDSKKSLLLSVL